MAFDTYWESNNSGNAFVYVGQVPSGTVYRNNREYSKHFNGGLVVSEGKIVNVLSVNEVNEYISESNRLKKKNE